MGRSFLILNNYDDALASHKEAIELCRAISAQYPLQYNEMIALTLHNYALALSHLGQFSEAAALEKEAMSLFRDLAKIGKEVSKSLCLCLRMYGVCCNSLGQHTEAVIVYQEVITIQRAQIARETEGTYLATALHHMANSLYALGKDDDADAAAIEALQMHHGELLRVCFYAPNFSSCFVYQRIITSNPLSPLAGPSLPLPAVPPDLSQGRKRDKFFMLFRRNRV